MYFGCRQLAQVLNSHVFKIGTDNKHSVFFRATCPTTSQPGRQVISILQSIRVEISPSLPSSLTHPE